MVDWSMKSKEKIKPFLKWVGGKQRLIDKIYPYVPSDFSEYREPFLGAGSMFIKLLNEGRLEDAVSVISDTNMQLVASWYAILHGEDSKEKIIKQLTTFEKLHSKSFYKQIINSSPFICQDVLARFLYINKAGFNGLYRENKAGKCNTPWGKRDKVNLGIENIKKMIDMEISDHAMCVQHDFLGSEFHFDKYVVDRSNYFYYIDPPYYPVSKTSSFTSYSNGSWSEENHLSLIERYKKLSKTGAKIMMSNSDTHFIREAMKDFKIIELETNRSVAADGGARKKVKELLILNY